MILSSCIFPLCKLEINACKVLAVRIPFEDKERPHVSGRDCVVPEVNRNKNIGKKGVNMDARVFKKFLGDMSWAEQGVEDFGSLDYLMKAQYEQNMIQLLDDAEVWEGPLDVNAFTPGKVFSVAVEVWPCLRCTLVCSRCASQHFKCYVRGTWCMACSEDNMMLCRCIWCHIEWRTTRN